MNLVTFTPQTNLSAVAVDSVYIKLLHHSENFLTLANIKCFVFKYLHFMQNSKQNKCNKLKTK